MSTDLPVIVIGAGPVGLAAAAHLLARDLPVIVFEAGDSIGAGMQRWAHVRMFSPWEFAIDRAANEILVRHGWSTPNLKHFPTGGDVVAQYLRPLAATPEMARIVHTGTRVTAVTRLRKDRMKDALREQSPFLVRYTDAAGEHELLAKAVVDASGTMDTPNPAGASGIPARGELALQAHIFYGMPDVLGRDRSRYEGKRVLVIGSGHSAFNVLADLAKLADQTSDMQIHWALRRPSVARVLGGGENDQLKERGRLGLTIADLVKRGILRVATGFHLDNLERMPEGIVASSEATSLDAVDEIVVATGFRPDVTLLSELRIALDHGTQAPTALAPLIDPNLHSCGSVRPHGAEELKHPDADIYIVGMKSYGRAPTFLLLTGYEQVRSVAAAIAGDWEAARRVELILPETGVCITQFSGEESEQPSSSSCCESVPVTATVASQSCCGGPAPAGADACCLEDAQAKQAGASGCGCKTTLAIAPRSSCCT
ncbi:FAD-dependent oxidoreductase [Pseudoxanthomonas mexicana]|uniref:FAD-dependent oxidoreductase n=1 Tax=Pseudoxanthomonas mexicana TaxID=128785 RepID=UPI000783C2CC|nr:FAD-dependent oxidoreductase [Pseudoxanthomonas mexicana]